jgi:hypothetical protein
MRCEIWVEITAGLFAQMVDHASYAHVQCEIV